MQGKPIGPLFALVLVALLAGCGGDGASSGAGSATEGGRLSDVTEKLQAAADRVREQRRGSQNRQNRPGAEGDEPAPPDAPRVAHPDSGGGAAQFRHKGGDNSIQEFGREASASERERAAAVLHSYLDSRVAHRWDAACFYMAAELVAGLERFATAYGQQNHLDGCGEILATLSGNAGQKTLEEAAQADVGSLRTDGRRGFLLYHGARGLALQMPVAKEGGAWKVAALDGSPLP